MAVNYMLLLVQESSLLYYERNNTYQAVGPDDKAL